MSGFSKVDAVASGKPYIVESVNDSTPGCLEDFVSEPVAAVTVCVSDQVVEIHGPAHVCDDAVVLHEKDCDGTGKDVRTWQIVRADDGFEAVQRAV